MLILLLVFTALFCGSSVSSDDNRTETTVIALPDALPDALPHSLSDALPDALPDAHPHTLSDALPDALPHTLPDAPPGALPDALPSDRQDTELDLESSSDDFETDDDLEEVTTPSEPSDDPSDDPELPEALPVAQPLVMDVSLEDVDYMTVLRPPPLPSARPPPSKPGSRPVPRGRKRKQKRRHRPQPGPNVVTETVHYHRGYPDYATEDEQRKSRERPREEFSLQHVDEVPFAFENVMRQVAAMGEPQYYNNHKSFGVDAQPSESNAEPTQHIRPHIRSPYQKPLTPQQPSHHQSTQDLYNSATVQVTRSVPLGEHHSSTSGDWLIGFGSGSGTAGTLSPPKSIAENSIEPSTPLNGPPATFTEDTAGIITSSSHAREPATSHPSVPPTSAAASSTTPGATTTVAPNAKRATLRDILLTDCPDAEEQGFCDSPPRYPTQQVNAVLRQCADLVELLHAPLPEINTDDDPSSIPGEEPVCPSTRQMLRPGYVRDVSTGRWFVAVQSRGRVTQLVPTERCNTPGRSCARLADSKCARNLGFRNGVRASACRQKWTTRPLLIWDPDRPSRCPQMAMVKLPDTCVCRLLPSAGEGDGMNKPQR